MLKLLLRALSVVDIGTCKVPAHDLFAVAAHRIATSEEPPVTSIAPAQAYLQLETSPARYRTVKLGGRLFAVVRMKGSTKLGSSPPLVETKTKVIKHDAVGVKAFAIWPVHRNKLRRQVQNLPELHLLLSDFVLGDLSFGDISYRTDKLAFARCILRYVSYRMDVFDSSVSHQQAILMFEVRTSLRCLIDD